MKSAFIPLLLLTTTVAFGQKKDKKASADAAVQLIDSLARATV